MESKSKKCDIIIPSMTKICPNRNCKNTNPGYNTLLTLTINLTDHTRTLSNVWFASNLFEKTFCVHVSKTFKTNQIGLKIG